MLCLCFQFQGLSPLHIAASIPGEEGVQITEYLLSSALDLDARAEDGNEVYGPDEVSFSPISSPFTCSSSDCRGHKQGTEPPSSLQRSLCILLD